LEDAQRKAVEQAVGTMISAETVMENYQIISDRILSKSTGYIRNFTIVTSSAKNGIFRVVIKAVVSTGALSSDVDAISALLKRKGMPRVFVAVAEGILGSTAFTTGQSGSAHLSAAEGALIKALHSRGFLIIDPEILSGKLELSQVYRKGDVPDGIARKIGSLSGAEVVIYGKAMVQGASLPMFKGQQVAFGNSSIRAVNVQTGEIIAMSNLRWPAKGAVPFTQIQNVAAKVLDGVGKSAADDLIKQIVKKWQKDTSGATRIVLTVTGVKFRSAKRLKAAMANLRGVGAINRRSLKRGKVIFDVSVKANPENFANSLDGLKIGRKKIEVTGVDGETVTATLAK
jgi:hypothetical protein